MGYWIPQKKWETEYMCVCVHIDLLWPLRLSTAQEKAVKCFGIFPLLKDKFSRNCNHNSWRVVKQDSITKVGVVNQKNLESLRIEKIGVVDTHFLFLSFLRNFPLLHLRFQSNIFHPSPKITIIFPAVSVWIRSNYKVKITLNPFLKCVLLF